VTTARIVVGVDHSDESIAALRWAIAQARATGALVEAVWAFQAVRPVPRSPTICIPAAEYAAALKASLSELVAAQGAGATVRVTTRVVEGRPADVLTDAARGASMLVLGSSGASRIIGLLTGSTDYAVIHHAPCPLVLIPLPNHAEPGK
jgi:nucleotide-binding universal stress UspA family protein